MLFTKQKSPLVTYKPGVEFGEGISMNIAYAILIASQVYFKRGVPLVVTSLRDGWHMPGSLHAKGLAADLRSRTLKIKDRPLVVKELREKLGSNYDIILEKDHIHIEWDPKKE